MAPTVNGGGAAAAVPPGLHKCPDTYDEIACHYVL